jgi:hypothetical protein
MCGEIDEQSVVGQELVDRLRAIASQMGLGSPGLAAEPPRRIDAAGRAAFMESVFRAGLQQAMADVSAAEDEVAVDALALHAIALARLAGFLAGQLPPEADLFRALIEALTSGHAEQREMAEEMLHARDHHHHHDHASFENEHP